MKILNEIQTEFEVAVEVAHSLKEVAVQAAKELEATWVILDRSVTQGFVNMCVYTYM